MSKCRYQISKEVLSSKIDDEMVLMSLKEGYYYSLESIGSKIWVLLSDQPLSIEELVDKLMVEYDVDPETCIRDVQAFIEDMTSKNLIHKIEG